MNVVIADPALRARIETALRAAKELQQKGALPPVLGDLLLLLDDSPRVGERAAPSVGVSESPSEQGSAVVVAPPPSGSATEAIIRTLWSAEERLSFVALSFLRDRLLPETVGIAAGTAGMAIHDALKDGVLLTDRIENPRNPKRPTTTVRLNRAHPTVRALVPEAAVPEPFEPIELRGAPLSSTVTEDRR